MFLAPFFSVLVLLLSVSCGSDVAKRTPCCSFPSQFPKTYCSHSLFLAIPNLGPPIHSIQPYLYQSGVTVPSYSSIGLLIIVFCLFALNGRPSRAITPFPLPYSFPQIVVFILPCVPYFSHLSGISVLY